MTVGYVFVVADLFHAGQLRHLRMAKKLCDFLIVGVLTDLAVATYKRKPITPFDERVDIINALDFINMVVRQDDRDPTETLKRLTVDGWHVDLLIHADDWPEIPGSEYIKSVGGRVIRTPYYQGKSTTKIIETIMDRARSMIP